MKVCVFGAGGVGSYLAAKLGSNQTLEVSAVGRGEHLDAIRRNGIHLVAPEGEQVVRLAAVATAASELPPQDIVFVTLKAQSLPAAADDLRGLLKPDGHAVFVMNGIPWWWNYGLDNDKGTLRRLDPEGRLWDRFGPERALGCVIYSSNSVTAPGTVTHLGNNRWIVGEPSRAMTPRLERTAEVLKMGGLNAEVTDDPRLQALRKLLRNGPFNSLSALIRLSPHDFNGVPGLADLAQEVTDEFIAVAAAKGWTLPPAPAQEVITSGGFLDKDAKAVERLRAMARPSMLTDVFLGRSLEVEALVGQVVEFGREEGAPIPRCEMLYTLLRGLDAYIQREAEAAKASKSA